MNTELPKGYRPLALRHSGFLQAIGPFFGRRTGDALSIGLRIEPRHCNSAGQAHGGMVLSLADVVLTVGSNFNARTSRFLPTVSLSCEFIQGAALGSWVEGTAEVLRVTGSHVFSQLLLRDEADTALARASGILLLRGEADAAFDRDRVF